MSITPSPVSPTQFRCVVCSYDLSGTAVGGYCPECGTAVEQSFPRPVGASTSGAAIAGLVCGILGFVVCGALAIVPLITFPMVRSQYRQGQCDRSSLTMATVGFWIGIAVLSLHAIIIAVLFGIGFSGM